MSTKRKYEKRTRESILDAAEVCIKSGISWYKFAEAKLYGCDILAPNEIDALKARFKDAKPTKQKRKRPVAATMDRMNPNIEYRPIPLGRQGHYLLGKDASVWWQARSGIWRMKKPYYNQVRRCMQIRLTYDDGKKRTHGFAKLMLIVFKPGTSKIGDVPFFKDANPKNCELSNLDWAPRGSCKLGSPPKGITSEVRNKMTAAIYARAKLTENNIPEIFRFNHEGWSLQDIADHYGVHQSTIHHVLIRKTWSHVQIDMNRAQNWLKGGDTPAAKLSEEDIPKIRQLAKEGWSQKDIADKFEVNQPCISLILAGKTWRSVPSED